MLEQQQGQLVSGLQEIYRRLQSAQAWPGPALSETNSRPLTHHILAALNLLETKHDDSGEMETFEEDYKKLLSRVQAGSSGYLQEGDAFSSGWDHSQQSQSCSVGSGTSTVSTDHLLNGNCNFRASPSVLSEDSESKSQLFIEDSNSSVLPCSLVEGPMLRQQHSYPQAQLSPLQQASPLLNDPLFYQAEWSIPDMGSPQHMLRSDLTQQAPGLQQSLATMANMSSLHRF